MAANRAFDQQVTVPVFKPGDIVWTVFPWPELYDAARGDICLEGLEQCKPVQVRVCMRKENEFFGEPEGASRRGASHKRDVYAVQFADQDVGEAQWGRFGQPWDKALTVPEPHMSANRTEIVERAASGLVAMRDQLNGAISALY